MNKDEYIKNGLTESQVRERTAKGQINADTGTKTKSVGEIIRSNVVTFFNLLNIILGALVIIVGSYRNALFLGVIFFNIAVGIFQELRAKRVIDKLSLISAPKATVIRDGKERETAASQIVLGDLMKLSAGKQICSDCVVLSGECEVNESLITGESDPVLKKAGDEMMSGSFVVSGQAEAEVIRVGQDNFASKITAGAKYIKKNNSVMLKSLDTIIKVIAVCIVPMAVGLFFNSIFISEQTTSRAVVSTVAALIGMIPEGLYLLASVVMAVSTIRLAAKKTLAQDMYCIETLARVDTLCLDKTGTITEGKMQVEDTELLKEGFPLDKAMIAFVENMSDDNPTFNAIKEKWGGYNDGKIPKAKNTVPFSSARKWSGAEFEEGSFIFGAPEFILGERYEEIKDKCLKAQENGLRVLIAAYSENGFRGHELPEEIEAAAIIYIGDVIRREAPDTLEFFDKQGVDIKIISGDNPVTVSKVAERAGVKNADKFVDASELADEDIPEAAKRFSVFGRVSPQQKLLLVKALKAQGRTVGMTGDGVNDVLALKEADCSIAMQSGSDAARSVSNLVLLDSNFASMPRVVAEGRRSVNNLQRSGALFLTKTIYSFILAFLFMFLPLPYPFQPIQLTLISTTAIGIPSFLLALEANTNIIRGSFIKNIFRRAMPQGIAVAVCSIASVLTAEFTDFPVDGMSTLTTVVVGAVSFFVIVRIMKPVKWWKIIMLVGIIAIFSTGLIFFKDIFMFQSLGTGGLIAAAVIFGCGVGIMLLLERVAEPIMDCLYRAFIKLRESFRKIGKRVIGR